MLPYLKPKSVAGLIIATRKPDGSKEEQHSEGNEDQGLIACAEDLIRAVHAKDAKSVSAALKAAYEICESYAEVPSDSNDYDSQNQKAAEYAKE